MITRNDKEQEIKALTERFAKAAGAFIVDYKGMKVEQVTTLRKQLWKSNSEMKVVRNTLAKRAFKDHPAVEKAFEGKMTGTNALVFSFGEVNATAKVLADFAKDVEFLQIKTGVMDGEGMDESKIKFLASLPGKDQLRAQLLMLFKEPSAKFVRLLDAFEKKQSAGSAEAAPVPQA